MNDKEEYKVHDSVEDFIESLGGPIPWYKRIWYKLSGSSGVFRHSIPFWTTYWFQKIFRKDHIADFEAWELGSHIVDYVYPRLKRYIELERHGYPTAFCDWDEGELGNPFKNKEELEKAVSEGNHYGGGMDGWNEVLRKIMVFIEFEHLENCTVDDERFNEYYRRNGFDLEGYCPYGQPGYKEFRKAYEEGKELFGKFFLAMWD